MKILKVIRPCKVEQIIESSNFYALIADSWIPPSAKITVDSELKKNSVGGPSGRSKLSETLAPATASTLK